MIDALIDTIIRLGFTVLIILFFAGIAAVFWWAVMSLFK